MKGAWEELTDLSLWWFEVGLVYIVFIWVKYIYTCVYICMLMSFAVVENDELYTYKLVPV